MQPQTKNIKYLHIVRGLAALLVVFFHAKYALWVGGTVYKNEVGLHGIYDYVLFMLDMLSSCGKECVVIFFILSAFVIKHSFISRETKWRKFFIIRLIRIYWPFLCSLIFSIIVLIVCVRFINPKIYSDVRNYNAGLSVAYDNLSFSQVLKTIFFIDSKQQYAGYNYAYWSLGHEAIFYLLFPFYYKQTPKILSAIAAVYLLLYYFTNVEIFYYQPFFIAGLLLHYYFIQTSDKPVIKSKLLYRVVLVLFFIAINLSNKIISGKFSDVVTLFYAFFIFDYVLYFVKNKNAALMQLGNISYSLYLNHLPLLMLWYAILSYATSNLIFYTRVPYYSGVVFAVLCAIPVYFLTERPSVNFLSKIKAGKFLK